MIFNLVIFALKKIWASICMLIARKDYLCDREHSIKHFLIIFSLYYPSRDWYVCLSGGKYTDSVMYAIPFAVILNLRNGTAYMTPTVRLADLRLLRARVLHVGLERNAGARTRLCD